MTGLLTPAHLDARTAHRRFTRGHRGLICLGNALGALLREHDRLVAATPDPWKLRVLADWLDLDDRRAGRTSSEVQDDLRRRADAIEAVRS